MRLDVIIHHPIYLVELTKISKILYIFYLARLHHNNDWKKDPRFPSFLILQYLAFKYSNNYLKKNIYMSRYGFQLLYYFKCKMN